jgi:hypothetical protein
MSARPLLSQTKRSGMRIVGKTGLAGGAERSSPLDVAAPERQRVTQQRLLVERGVGGDQERDEVRSVRLALERSQIGASGVSVHGSASISRACVGWFIWNHSITAQSLGISPGPM